MWQVIYRIPIGNGIPIYGFGLMLFLTFILTTWLASRRAALEGIGKDVVESLAIWLFLGGLLGARITYLLSHEKFASLGDFLWKLPQIWEGGIVLYGSMVGGTAAFFLAWALYYRRQGLSALRFADAVAPAIALGVLLGRIGCLLNGCCYGQVTCAECALVTPITFPLSAPCRETLVYSGAQTAAGFTFKPGLGGAHVGQVDPDSEAYKAGLRPNSVITKINGEEVKDRTDVDRVLGSLASWPRGERWVELTFQTGEDQEEVTRRIAPRTLGVYPTQIYETISMTLLLMVLLAYHPFRHYPGQVVAVLMVGYGFHRYLNEILRDDPRPEGLESYGSVFVILAGVVLWLALEMVSWRRGAGSSIPGGRPGTPAPLQELSPPG